LIVCRSAANSYYDPLRLSQRVRHTTLPSIVQPAAPEPLRFPRGVRFPRRDEIPGGGPPDAFERLKDARITTGFVSRAFDKQPGVVYFEANAHADRVWVLFKDLALAILPAAAAPIIGVKEDEPVLGPYTTRDAAIAVFESFIETLQHDGFLKFGVMFQRRAMTDEVFVRSAKHLQVWTTQPEIVRSVFARHSLVEVPDLQFIDEYARVTETLSLPDGRAGWPIALESIRAAFESLPSPPGIDAPGA